MTDNNGSPAEIEIRADEYEDLDELYVELRGAPGLTVEAISAPVEPGEQGAALDLLMVALSSGAITAFLQIIKTLAEAKGPRFSLTIRRGKDRLKITADNFDDVEPLVRKLLEEKQTPSD
jgi:Effector Associated Constant Component 1